MKLTRRRLFAGAAVMATLFGGAATARAASARYFDGPASDHFDGVRFFDPYGPPPKPFSHTLRFWTMRYSDRWPERVPSTYSDSPPATVAGTDWRFSFVGHATMLLQTGGLNFLFDPVWSERASPFSFVGPKRVNDPGIAFDALPKIDHVLVSHNHYDHLDVMTLSRLAARDKPRVIAPLGNDTIMHAHDPEIGAEAFDWHERVELAPGFAVTLIPVRHWSARGLLDRNKALWAGFMLDTPAGRILYVGDTGYGTGKHFRDARERFGPIRMAVLPIGAYEPRWFMRDQHMNPAEAVKAANDLGVEIALAHHHGTFQLTAEQVDAPPKALTVAMNDAGMPAERFRVLAPGQVLEVTA